MLLEFHLLWTEQWDVRRHLYRRTRRSGSSSSSSRYKRGVLFLVPAEKTRAWHYVALFISTLTCRYLPFTPILASVIRSTRDKLNKDSNRNLIKYKKRIPKSRRNFEENKKVYSQYRGLDKVMPKIHYTRFPVTSP